MRSLKRLVRSAIGRTRMLMRKSIPKMNPGDAKRLHLGCGNIRLPGSWKRGTSSGRVRLPRSLWIIWGAIDLCRAPHSSPIGDPGTALGA